jgi:hypothetical protein
MRLAIRSSISLALFLGTSLITTPAAATGSSERSGVGSAALTVSTVRYEATQILLRRYDQRTGPRNYAVRAARATRAAVAGQRGGGFFQSRPFGNLQTRRLLRRAANENRRAAADNASASAELRSLLPQLPASAPMRNAVEAAAQRLDRAAALSERAATAQHLARETTRAGGSARAAHLLAGLAAARSVRASQLVDPTPFLRE